MSIKLKQPTMRLANLFFFCKSSDVVEWSCFFALLVHPYISELP